ncbi:hypothetical protein WA026_020622 [Henosepilachna vigintioctopunctata]|uniref:Rab-GAP TBC domain-containing protein n=1 Tax=Henosepilachna vigintioctopunctata TaxID=420089 RepID=A0AAW1V234_9CUCU
MKTDCNIKEHILGDICKNEQEVSHLIDYNLISDSCILQCSTDSVNGFCENRSMGLKNQYYKHISNDGITEDSRCQSLPDCFVDEIENEVLGVVSDCDTKQNLLEVSIPPQCPSAESWFKTWPERCDKVKSNETSPSNSLSNKCKLKNTPISKCDINIPRNGLSLNEALQNISLAYSPITKQLHLVENSDCNTIDKVDTVSTNKYIDKNIHFSIETANSEQKILGHRRIQAGSFSSTVSSISEPSTSGSLLDPDERSLSNFEEYTEQPSKKKTFTNFLNRNVFTWRPPDVQRSVGHVWKLFGKNPHLPSTSPQHVVVSSSALIQHPRPSNLPAKSVEEEEKHREEYRAILAAAKRKDALNCATRDKLEKKQLKEEERLANASKHFTQHVLLNWETMKCNKKTRELWWQGLPSNVRGKVWCLAIGNELNLTQQLYEICLARAQARLKSTEPNSLELAINQEQSLDVIQLDISRTFPHLGIFQEGGPYSEVLHSLLAAYVCYRPDVGYVQGMSYIAAILILNMEQYNAFICFANLLNQPLHLSAFTLNQNQMHAYYEAYNEFLKYNLPKLYSHFQKSGLTPDLYLLDWIYTIFAKAMPLDVACRIWDVFLRDGFEFIFRTALGILYLHQDVLLKMDFVDGAQFLTRLPDNISTELLFKSIQTISMSIGKQSFGQIVEKHMPNNELRSFSMC